MSRPVQATKLERTLGAATHDSVETHPAFGIIGASRVSGRAVLFGSDFEHQHFLIIRISRAVLHRGLSNDWHHAREELIEVALSEAQWATFVSTLNVGDGVPCTLDAVAGEQMPGIQAPTARHEQFKQEANEAIIECTAAMKDALDLLAEMGGGEKSKTGKVAERVRWAQRSLTDALPWVAQQFGEHMEAVTEKAKVEISAYMHATIARAGLRALGAESPPIAFPQQKKEGDE